MNRREFFFFTKDSAEIIELSCEQLYMRYLDSTLDGSTAQLFTKIEQSLATAARLHLIDTAWLNCHELKPIGPILDRFRKRGGQIVHSHSS